VVALLVMPEFLGHYSLTAVPHLVCDELERGRYVEYCFVFFLDLQALCMMWAASEGFSTDIDVIAGAKHCCFQEGKGSGFAMRPA
jgi:hypothetical protein